MDRSRVGAQAPIEAFGGVLIAICTTFPLIVIHFADLHAGGLIFSAAIDTEFAILLAVPLPRFGDREW
jgi:hypothetical protein